MTSCFATLGTIIAIAGVILTSSLQLSVRLMIVGALARPYAMTRGRALSGILVR